jgi:hypothetical protein
MVSEKTMMIDCVAHCRSEPENLSAEYEKYSKLPENW